MKTERTTRKIRIGVLVSGKGRGTNLQAIIDACADGRIPGQVVIVISTTPGTPAIERAQRANIPTCVLPRRDFPSDEALDEAILKILQEARVDLVCLAGYMRKVGPRLCSAYRWRMMNIHPALLPSFKGKGLYGEHVHKAVLDYGCKVSGCTVHFVTEEYDEGPIIAQTCVPVEEGDTPETLAARILPKEHETYVKAIRLFAEGRLVVEEGRRVRILGEAKEDPS